MIIAIDFDGTIVEDRYPDIGVPVVGAFEWMKKFQAAGAKLILYTMRSDDDIEVYGYERRELLVALNFCREHGIEFWAANENPEQKEWTSSPKVHAHRYIDDRAAGVPLKPAAVGGPLVVDWDAIGPGLLKEILVRCGHVWRYDNHLDETICLSCGMIYSDEDERRACPRRIG